MEGYRPCWLPHCKQAWRMSMAVVLSVVVMVVLVAALPIMLCQLATGSVTAENCSVGLARLEESLAVTSQTLAKARGQCEGFRKDLGALEEKFSELAQALARVTQLQEENRALKAEVAQQQEQLGDLQSQRDQLQVQNQLLQKQLQDLRSQDSGGNRFPATSLGLLALLLPGMLLL